MGKELILFKALADETRLKIIKFLLNGEKCVCEIFPYIKRTQSTTSIQLDVLKKAGVVSSRRKGKKVYYSISDKKVYDVFDSLDLSKKKTSKKHIQTNKSNK